MANTKITTGKCRLSFPNLFTPRTDQNGENPKYGVKLLIPKSDKATLRAMRSLQKEALEQGNAGRFGGKKLKGVPGDGKTWPWDTIHDGDDSDYEEDRGHWTVNASTKMKPSVVDRNLNPILDPNEIYPGCYVRVSLVCFPYSTNGKTGVTFGLGNVQKLGDGEPLGGLSRPEDDFDELDDDEDDEDDLI